MIDNFFSHPISFIKIFNQEMIFYVYLIIIYVFHIIEI